MKEIYNEGRVVGLSAYEIYVRHSLNTLPDEEILTEREWLSSTLGNGSSLILRVSAGTEEGIHDYPLPDNCMLCSCQTITASMFNGDCTFSDVNGQWATSVRNYGPLINNTSSSYPVTPGSSTQVPYNDNLEAWDTSNANRLRDYLKIIDGVVIQPGTWSASQAKQGAYSDLYPDLSKTGFIRLRTSKELDEDVYILLTGFLFKPLVAGISKIEGGSTDTEHPENGDFLGSEVYPWASKIIFTVPSESFNILNTKGYIREFQSGSEQKSVDKRPVIDYESTDPGDYYKNYPEFKDSEIPIIVNDLNIVGSGASVLGTYQRTDKISGGYTGTDYPPVLYGAQVTKTGPYQMSPVDIAAPGTVKMFEDKDLALNYPKIFPNIYALYEKNGDIYIIDEETEEDDLVSVTTKVDVMNKGTDTAPQYIASTRARDAKTEEATERTIHSISMQDDEDNELNTSGSESSSYTDTNGKVKDDTWLNGSNGLSWEILLNALGLNKKIELLGVPLRIFRSKLPNVVSGEGGVLDILGTGQSKIAGSLAVNGTHSGSNALTDDAEFKFNKPVKSGANYITFSNGLRLYIAKNQPTDDDVPVGSIGIGWGISSK